MTMPNRETTAGKPKLGREDSAPDRTELVAAEALL